MSNTPNQLSDSNPEYRKLSGESKRLIHSVTDDVVHKLNIIGLKAKEESDLDRLVSRAQGHYNKVYREAIEENEILSAAGKIDSERLSLIWDTMGTKFLGEFRHYHREELLFLLCHFMAGRIAEQVV